MSLITKVIIDTAEYNRLLNIEHEYKILKNKETESRKSEPHQSGSGCSCTAKKCSCPTPPLSEIIAVNERARSVDPLPKGLLPSITDPNDRSNDAKTTSGDGEEAARNIEKLDHNEWRTFADDKSKWYFLGHYEEN